MDMMSPVRMEILGTTKELLDLSIRDISVFKRSPLRLTNTDELLGAATAPPFCRAVVGRNDAYETVARPDRPSWLLGSGFDEEGRRIEKTNRTQAVQLRPGIAKYFPTPWPISIHMGGTLRAAWQSVHSRLWVRLLFTRGKNMVEFSLLRM